MSKRIQKMINEEETFITVRNVRIVSVLICLLAVAVSAFFGVAKEVALGAFLGGAAAQLVFRQHEIALYKSFDGNDEKTASRITVINYILRLIVRITVLIVAIKNPDVNVIGCIIGLLSISYSICAIAYFDNLVRKKTGKEV